MRQHFSLWSGGPAPLASAARAPRVGRIALMNIADMRREYMRAGLDETAAGTDPIALFRRWLGDAVDAGADLPNAMILATVGRDGQPSARAVLLKGIEENGFVFYTNTLSRKGQELSGEPRASLVFLWGALERQVRIEGRTEAVSAADADAYFESRPLGARLSAIASQQSERVADRAALESAYAAAEARYGERPPRPEHWSGYRLLPASIEFWQGRENRLHDRLKYGRAGGRWTRERLAP